MADEDTEVAGGPVAEPKKEKPPTARPKAKAGTVVVAEGKAICCAKPRGIKTEGEVIDADMFLEGQKQVDNLIKKKYAVKT